MIRLFILSNGFSLKTIQSSVIHPAVASPVCWSAAHWSLCTSCSQDTWSCPQSAFAVLQRLFMVLHTQGNLHDPSGGFPSSWGRFPLALSRRWIWGSFLTSVTHPVWLQDGATISRWHCMFLMWVIPICSLSSYLRACIKHHIMGRRKFTEFK